MGDEQRGILILENGLRIEGISFGSSKPCSGEVVFNTGMVGYPESLTDPSYRAQILVLTYPLIGNYGVPSSLAGHNGLQSPFESDKVQIAGLIVANYSEEYSHWSAVQSLGEWLKENNVPALQGIDTRALTKVLREKGTLRGKIVFDSENSNTEQSVVFDDPNTRDIVQEVSCTQPILYNKEGKKKIILIDCGVKYSIIRHLVARDLAVLRVPHTYNFLHESFDGVVISNGPGDPAQCLTTIAHVRSVIDKEIPLFGICLGNQILARAAGGTTYKLNYGHRSQNQPCILVGTKRCYITSQNHGFAVKMDSLPGDWMEFFVNANDGTNEGIRHRSKPFMSVQFHPENAPGPSDTEFLFDDFVKLLR